VPALVINDRQFISGGQSPEEFERLIRAAASGDLEAAA
jgi:predicted DsbA family dithiol-disulfide isomerase